jgi:hypothetical protein
MPKPAMVTDAEVRALLERFACPTPFHAVRTHLLGNIASPALGASPMKAVSALWGGELPVFESEADVNLLIGGLVMGLWNQLGRHQSRTAPFRLTRIEVPATYAGVARLALLRREEVDGFIEGLFGAFDELDFPDRAEKSVNTLQRMCDVLETIRATADGMAIADDSEGSAEWLGQLRELAKIAEHEMHEAVLSCARARKQEPRPGVRGH